MAAVCDGCRVSRATGGRTAALRVLAVVLASAILGAVAVGGCGGRQTGGPTETTNEKTQPTSPSAVPTGKQ
jgi:hypothetical protein